MGLVAAIDWEGGLEDAWDAIIVFVPKLLGFLLILGIGYFIAKAIEKVLDKLLERVGFDRIVERGGVKRALSRSRLDASSILSRIVFYIAFLFVLQLAFSVFDPNPITDLLEGVIAFLPKLFVAVIIVVITAAIATGAKTIIESMLGGMSYGQMLATIASVAIWFIGIAAALNQIEVAPAIVNGLFYAVLALVVGVGIVAIGGGGIAPMRERWQRALTRMDAEGPRLKQQAAGGTEVVREKMDEVRREVSDARTEQTSSTTEPRSL